MAEEKSLFERLDDISVGQETILNELGGVKTQVGTNDDRIAELEKEIQKLKSQPKPVPQTQQSQPAPVQDERTILRAFLKKAKKSWMWFGNNAEFNRARILAIISLVLLFVVGLASTIISSICFKMYSTFTFFENVWLIFGIFYLVYAIRAKHKYEAYNLACNSPSKFRKDELDMWEPIKEKGAFKVFRWITIISVIGNIVCIWSLGYSIKGVATVVEIMFLGAIIFAHIMNTNLFAQYSIIYVEGHNLTTKERVVLVLPPGAKELMTEEDFKKKMPFFYE